MKFIAQITGQRIILADGTAYRADGRKFDIQEHHAAEVLGMGFVKSEAPADKIAEAKAAEPAPVAEVDEPIAENKPRSFKRKGSDK